MVSVVSCLEFRLCVLFITHKIKNNLYKIIQQQQLELEFIRS